MEEAAKEAYEHTMTKRQRLHNEVWRSL